MITLQSYIEVVLIAISPFILIASVWTIRSRREYKSWSENKK